MIQVLEALLGAVLCGVLSPDNRAPNRAANRKSPVIPVRRGWLPRWLR